MLQGSRLPPGPPQNVVEKSSRFCGGGARSDPEAGPMVVGAERLRGAAVQDGVKALRERAPDAKAVPSAALVLNGGFALHPAGPALRPRQRQGSAAPPCECARDRAA